jgi:SP family arabinose:H+ symporter-like MFS transporter
MNKLLFWSLVSALAGFLFGFDTVVISGAEKSIQELWDLSAFMHGLAISGALWGTVIGSLVGAIPTDRFGRRKTLIWIGGLYLISSLWSALAGDVHSFIFARFLGGLGIGISTITSPLFISEIAPPASRGRRAGMFQFNIVFGILMAFLSNYLIGKYVDDHAWRWMLGVMAIPSLIYMVCCIRLPESPRWLIANRGLRNEGIAVLRKINPAMADAEIQALANSIESAAARENKTQGFWSGHLRTPILLAFFIAFFNQLSGINAILYFAPRIFEMTGLAEKSALLQSIGIGVTNLIFTFVGLRLIDRLGRRTLLYLGSFGYILSLGLCAFAFFQWSPSFKVGSAALAVAEKAALVEAAAPGTRATAELEFAKAKASLIAAASDPNYAPGPVTIPELASLAEVKLLADATVDTASSASRAGGLMVMLCIFAFIASHAIGQGAVIWVFISEIFPNRFRATGQSLGSATHWVFAALLTLFFPKMVVALQPGVVFLFFMGMMVLQLVWIKLMVPETKGVSLEGLETKLTHDH